jgi:hypothetical protein
MAFEIEHDEIFKGLRCVVLFTDMGHRCGYVGIGKDHPFYQKDYSDNVPQDFITKWHETLQGTVGKRSPIDVLCMVMSPDNPKIGYLFDVHGGITYAGGGKKYPVDDERWYFGFDCAHCDDAPDSEAASEYGFKLSPYRLERHGTMRSKDYVIQECHNLADQLLSIN